VWRRTQQPKRTKTSCWRWVQNSSCTQTSIKYFLDTHVWILKKWIVSARTRVLWQWGHTVIGDISSPRNNVIELSV
jgi:hypothetical protein